MSHIVNWNKFECMRVVINSFITHFLIFVSYSKVPLFSRIALSHICWVLYQLGTCFITNGIFFNLSCFYRFYLLKFSKKFSVITDLPMHEKPYFASPGISRKAQKGQINIIFPSTFWLKKDRISHHRIVQNKNFSVIKKILFLSSFCFKKRPYFPSPKNSKQETFSNQ